MMKNKKGFTLIEVVLVLAIGGLILAMVFIAVPNLSALQRDNERRDDMMLFIDNLQRFKSNNNRGALPSGTPPITISGTSITFGQTDGTTWADFYKGYFHDNFVDPSSTERYNWKIIECGRSNYGKCQEGNNTLTTLRTGTFKQNDYNMYIIIGATCDSGDAVYSPNNRNVAVLYRLERGELYCANT